MKYQNKDKLWNEDYAKLPWYIRSKRGQMRTFATVVVICLISWAALMVSIVFTQEALAGPVVKLKTLEERVALLEAEMSMVDQILWVY